MWDIRDVCCIQTIPSRLLTPGPVVISSIYFNDKNHTLLMGTNALFAFEKKGKTKSNLTGLSNFGNQDRERVFTGLYGKDT